MRSMASLLPQEEQHRQRTRTGWWSSSSSSAEEEDGDEDEDEDVLEEEEDYYYNHHHLDLDVDLDQDLDDPTALLLSTGSTDWSTVTAGTANATATAATATHTVLPRGEFWANVVCVLLVAVCGEASRGLVVTSQTVYVQQALGGSAQLYGACVSIFSVGRLISGLLFGVWARHRPVRQPVVAGLLLCLCGNLMYCLASLLDPNYANHDPTASSSSFMNPPSYAALYVVLFSRMVVGAGTGSVIVIRALVAAITPPELRTRYLAWTTAAQYVGFALTPILENPISHVRLQMGSLLLDADTAPGFILAIVYVALIPLVFILMSPIPPPEKVPRTPSISPYGRTLFIGGACLWIFFNCISRSGVALVETIGTPLFMQVTHREENPASEAAASNFFFVRSAGCTAFTSCTPVFNCSLSSILYECVLFLPFSPSSFFVIYVVYCCFCI